MSANAEREAREVWGTEDGATSGQDDPHGKTGLGSDGGGLEHLRLGTPRAAGPWGGLSNAIAGGIISQLIEETHDRLGESEAKLRKDVECIEWYQREAEESRRRIESDRRKLDNLFQLQKMVEQAQADESAEK